VLALPVTGPKMASGTLDRALAACEAG